MLKRKIETVLKTWKNTPGHKPLLAPFPAKCTLLPRKRDRFLPKEFL